MNNILYGAGVLLGGYILGAIPFAVLIARLHGVDIFSVGSKNPGATNVVRSVGRKAGYVVFLLDFLKGVTATVVPLMIFKNADNAFYLGVIGLCGAVVGHSSSCFIGFRGGKGVAVTMGGLLALMPFPLLIGGVIWAACFYITRYVSVASIAFGLSLPVTGFFIAGWQQATLGFFIAIFTLYKHNGNIKRLIEGKENRFERKNRKEKLK